MWHVAECGLGDNVVVCRGTYGEDESALTPARDGRPGDRGAGSVRLVSAESLGIDDKRAIGLIDRTRILSGGQVIIQQDDEDASAHEGQFNTDFAPIHRPENYRTHERDE